MYIGKVDLPEELITGPQEDLVIFIGAGVSVSLPSGLPLFESLTKKVAAHFGENITDSGTLDSIKKAPDQYLGQLKSKGLDVNAVVKQFIDLPGSEPNNIHRSLVRLFSTPEKLRIVTTNYDRHLEKSLAEDFGTVPIYQSPALPMGNDFTGIVHLHGSIEQESKRLVVTDSDFGKAYLTEAWAARFLYDLYRTYRVLFIGYSHSDWMMQYLARGLPENAEHRYALVGIDDSNIESRALWARLGIQVVEYPLVGDDHGALEEFISQWAALSRMGLLEHEARLQSILSGPPPVEREELDYVKRNLFDQSLGPIICKYLHGREWLQLLLDIPEFFKLFTPVVEHNPHLQPLAMWFVENFVVKDSEHGMGVVVGTHNHVSNDLWNAIARSLFRKDFPSGRIKERWTAILIEMAPGKYGAGENLSAILNTCSWDTDSKTILLLLDVLFSPIANFRLSYAGGSIGEVEIFGSEHVVNSVWNRLIVPNFELCANQLTFMLLHNLGLMSSMIQNLGTTNGQWDSLSFRRSAIEPHPQDSYQGSTDILIDATRDLFSFLIQSNPLLASGYIQLLSSSSTVIIRRIAVHLCVIRSDISADEKLDWLLSQDFLFEVDLKHEVFQLLKISIGNASARMKNELISKARERWGGHSDNENLDLYNLYNLAVWLVSIDSSFTEAGTLSGQLQIAHGFQPREHPDFDHWMGFEAVEAARPMPVETMLDFSPEKVLIWLQEQKHQREENVEEIRLSYFNNDELVREAVTENPNWGLALARHLILDEIWLYEIWELIFRGLTMATLEANTYRQILNEIPLIPDLLPFRNLISNLVEKVSLNEATTDTLTLLRNICFRLWELPDEVADIGHDDALDQKWLDTAINRWSGKIALVLLRQLSRLKEILADEWDGLDPENDEILLMMIQGTQLRNGFARSVITSQIHFLNSIDSVWTRQNILPLLDWDLDENTATQAWDGFLAWGRIDQNLVVSLLPNYFKGLEKFLDVARQDRICEHLSWIALYSTDAAPESNAWLREFIHHGSEKNLATWAKFTAIHLERSGSTFADTTWERWIDAYWAERLNASPKPFSSNEGNEMLGWIFLFIDHRQEAIERMTRTPVDLSESPGLYDFFQVQNFGSDQSILADLLIHILPTINRSNFYWHTELKTVFEALRNSNNVAIAKLRGLCEEAIRLGCTDARDWLS